MKLLLLTIATLVSISANAALVTRTTFNAATNALAAEIATKQDTIWNNSGGVISPASGQVTNVLRFTSGLADNATNVAMVVDTDVAWPTFGADILALRGAGTNLYRFGSTGYVWFTGLGGTSELQIDAGSDSHLDLNATDSGGTYLIIKQNNKTGVQLWPGTSDPFFLNATTVQSSGTLFIIYNDGTVKQSVAFDGATTIAQSADEPAAPAAGYFTLFATNNAGKMVLKVKFPTGASQVIATEP